MHGITIAPPYQIFQLDNKQTKHNICNGNLREYL